MRKIQALTLSLILLSQLTLAKPMTCPTAEQVNQTNFSFNAAELNDWADTDNTYDITSVPDDLNIAGATSHWYLEILGISADNATAAKSQAVSLAGSLTSAGSTPLTSLLGFTYCSYITKDGSEAALWLAY